MPRKVDHQERRTLIADALMRVAATGGIEAVSLRHVAAEAGVTAGMVQHYFATKDDMMRFALGVVMDRTTARVTEAMAGQKQPVSPAVLVRTLLHALLPLDEPRRADGRVALAFLAYSAVEPAAAELLTVGTRQTAEFLAEQIRQVRPDGDAEATAIALLATMEGLGIYLLGGHCRPEDAVRALDVHLDLVFPD
jgi:AcrR family transcriptional regulator